MFEKVFWDEDRDMFGLLRDSTTVNSIDPGDYVAARGRFYLFWNCIKSSGRPTLGKSSAYPIGQFGNIYRCL